MNSDVLLIEDALFMTWRAPFKQVWCSVVCTKLGFYIVPKKTVGMYVLFDVIRTHPLFEDGSIVDGLNKLISDSDSVQQLDESLKDLLGNDEIYIYSYSDAKSVRIKGLFGKKTLMWRQPKNWASFNPKSSAEGKKLKEFYPNF